MAALLTGIVAVVIGDGALLTFSGDVLLALGLVEAQQFHNQSRRGRRGRGE